MSDLHEVTTLLRIRDEATAPLQRFVTMLRAVQAELTTALAGLERFRSAMAPSAAALAGQREALGLVAREAELRASITAETAKQSESILAARRASLTLAKDELVVQQSIVNAARGGGAGGGGSWRSAANRIGGNLMWGGAGVLGGLAYATQQAMDFNQLALEADVALGGYRRSAAQRAVDIRAISRAAMTGSEATGFFSAQQILEGLKTAASSGARPLVEKMGMGTFTAIAPALSRYMDVIGRLKGEDASSAAMEGIRVAHMFGAYTPDAINRILNAQAALALLMPDKMSTATTTAAYVAPSGVNLAGIPQEAILALLATADQSGLGRGRAGARLKDYVETIAVTQSRAREHAKAALGLGGALDAHGNLDLMKSFDILIADSKKMSPQAFRDQVRTAFGSPGSVVAAMFGDDNKRSMFEANRKVIEDAVSHGDLQTIQDILKGGPAGQEALAVARLRNDVIQFGQYGIPIAVKFFDAINPKLKQFGDWLDQHPDDARRLFDDLLRAGEGMLALGAAVKTLSMIATTVSAIRTLSSAIGAVAGATTGVPAALGGVAAALRGIAAAGTAFLASPFGKVMTAAGVFFGTTSFEPQDDARKQLIANYGYDYWRYLKGRHPGTNPYSFNPGEGDLTPSQFRNLHLTPQAQRYLNNGGGFGPSAQKPIELRVSVDVRGVRTENIKTKVQLSKKQFGAYATTPFWSIPPGSYYFGTH